MPSIVARLVNIKIAGIVVRLNVALSNEAVSTKTVVPKAVASKAPWATLLVGDWNIDPANRNSIAVVKGSLDGRMEIRVANSATTAAVLSTALGPGLTTQKETEESEGSELDV